jgi:phospholipase/lecithinase/hemolysin
LYSPRLRGGFARVRVAAERIGIEVVDPTPVLAADEHRASLYLFPADHHPNARGHAMIAATIARSLNVRECPRNAGGSMPGDLPAARQSE